MYLLPFAFIVGIICGTVGWQIQPAKNFIHTSFKRMSPYKKIKPVKAQVRCKNISANFLLSFSFGLFLYVNILLRCS